MDEADDLQLITRFRGGSEAALETLFERYEGPVYRFLFGILKNHHAAEDAAQETFIQALRHSDAVNPSTFRGWIFTVAHQQAMLLKRREKRLPVSADDSLLLGLVDREPDRASQLDDARRVRELLALLPDSQRAVIAARVFEGKKFREVAASLGCPLNTALARMHDGLAKLKQLWEARYA